VQFSTFSPLQLYILLLCWYTSCLLPSSCFSARPSVALLDKVTGFARRLDHHQPTRPTLNVCLCSFALLCCLLGVSAVSLPACPAPPASAGCRKCPSHRLRANIRRLPGMGDPASNSPSSCPLLRSRPCHRRGHSFCPAAAVFVCDPWPQHPGLLHQCAWWRGHSNSSTVRLALALSSASASSSPPRCERTAPL
jgi:hypothetical protein